MRSLLPVTVALATVTLFGALAGASAQQSDIGVVPPRVTVVVPAGDSVTESVQIISDLRRVVDVDVGDWSLSPSGTIAFFSPGSAPHSAAAWLELEAESISVPADALQPFRFAVRVPEDAGPGTHHAMVFFSVLSEGEDEDRVGTNTVARLGVAVYVTVAGTETAGSEIVDFYRVDDRQLMLVLYNAGNTVGRFSGQVELRGERGETIASVPITEVPILRGSEREIEVALPEDLPSGFVSALALVEDSRGGVLAGEVPLEIP